MVAIAIKISGFNLNIFSGNLGLICKFVVSVSESQIIDLMNNLTPEFERNLSLQYTLQSVLNLRVNVSKILLLFR